MGLRGYLGRTLLLNQNRRADAIFLSLLSDGKLLCILHLELCYSTLLRFWDSSLSFPSQSPTTTRYIIINTVHRKRQVTQWRGLRIYRSPIGVIIVRCSTAGTILLYFEFKKTIWQLTSSSSKLRDHSRQNKQRIVYHDEYYFISNRGGTFATSVTEQWSSDLTCSDSGTGFWFYKRGNLPSRSLPGRIVGKQQQQRHHQIHIENGTRQQGHGIPEKDRKSRRHQGRLYKCDRCRRGERRCQGIHAFGKVRPRCGRQKGTARLPVLRRIGNDRWFVGVLPRHVLRNAMGGSDRQGHGRIVVGDSGATRRIPGAVVQRFDGERETRKRRRLCADGDGFGPGPFRFEHGRCLTIRWNRIRCLLRRGCRQRKLQCTVSSSLVSIRFDSIRLLFCFVLCRSRETLYSCMRSSSMLLLWLYHNLRNVLLTFCIQTCTILNWILLIILLYL